MKKILIPTDFSSSAKNAAHYAMHLAKEMKNDQVVNRNAAHADVSLVVMGTADDGKISRFLL